MLSRTPGITLKYQLKDFLCAKLEQLNFGDKIPSEDNLAEEYGVSRGTIRQVINELTGQGLLFRIQGKGTFKSGITVYNSGFMITSLTEQLKKGGFLPGIKAKKITLEVPDIKVATKLGIDEKEPVWRISRIRLANGSPISTNTAFVPKSLIPQLTISDFEMSFLEMLTEKFKIRLLKSENFCSAILSDKTLANQLSIEVGRAILHIEHIAYGLEGRPVYLDISNAVGDRYTQRFEQSGNN
jgi:GntR family transcriptional regulator